MSLLKDLTAITTPALSDIVYCVQNDTDFKVTNAQLLDLIKTNTVIPLTQAAYDALPSADKNNGALYVITDAVITAADIEYSSGVSVADKIDDLNGLVKVVFSGNISKTLTANQNIGILGTEIIPAANMPSGYTVIGLLSSYSTNDSCIMHSYDASVVGTSGTFCFIKNNTASSQSITVNYRIVFMKSDYVS